MIMLQGASKAGQASPPQPLFDAKKPSHKSSNPMFAGISAKGLKTPATDEVRFGRSQGLSQQPDNTTVTLKKGDKLSTAAFLTVLGEVSLLLNNPQYRQILAIAITKFQDPGLSVELPKQALYIPVPQQPGSFMPITIIDEKGNLSPEFKAFIASSLETVPEPANDKQRQELDARLLEEENELLGEELEVATNNGVKIHILRNPRKVSASDFEQVGGKSIARLNAVFQAAKTALAESKVFADYQEAQRQLQTTGQLVQELLVGYGDQGFEALKFLTENGITDEQLVEVADLFGGSHGLVEAFRKNAPALTAYAEIVGSGKQVVPDEQKDDLDDIDL